jgi:hypothetical protein
MHQTVVNDSTSTRSNGLRGSHAARLTFGNVHDLSKVAHAINQIVQFSVVIRPPEKAATSALEKNIASR